MGVSCSGGHMIVEVGEPLDIKPETACTAELKGTQNLERLRGSRLDDPETRRALLRHQEELGEEDSDDDGNYADEEDTTKRSELEAEMQKQAEEENEAKQKEKKFKNPSTMAADLRKKMAKKFKSDDPAWNAIHIMHGNPYVECRKNIQVVRIFTSSTFTDTKVERNTLMEGVYPKLKEFCKRKGYEFQIVDMRWGVRSEAEDDHMTTDLCMKELYACQEVSTGPNFITFLSHRYGYQPIPRVIEEKEFEQVITSLSGEDKDLLLQWYRLDQNHVPPSYLLQPISVNFPDYVSSDRDVYRAAKNHWWDVFEKLRAALLMGVDANIKDTVKKRLYHRAVTETEISAGILDAEKVGQQTLWFKRRFTDLEEKANTYDADSKQARTVSKFYDGDLNPASKPMLQDLRDKRLPKKLPASNIIEYPIHWDDKGVNTEVPEHRKYIEKLCTDVRTRTEAMIDQGIADRQREENPDALYIEVVQHVSFCRDKCAAFNGRDEILGTIQTYISDSKLSCPLILHGESGSGKTALMAFIANMAWEWMGRKSAVVFRFIGTTPDSSSIHPLLANLVSQLLRLYVGKGREPATELKYLIEEFRDLLKLPTKDKPLLLILDSLDQLDQQDGGQNLHWLPQKLPPFCKLLVSTLPDKESGILPKLKGLYKDQFVELTRMRPREVDDILMLWLSMSGRQLTTAQRDIIIAAYNICPNPLFLKLIFADSLRWHSYDDVSMLQRRLLLTVEDTIRELLERVEKSHGYLLVRATLGALTLAKGLTEPEIEDLMSLDDKVLNDVYQYHVPPMRRLPPLLWVRVRYDLEQYMVTRGADGVRVISWYYRQFRDTAEQRYLADKTFTKGCHVALAEYFSGKWADTPKPYMDSSGESRETLRYVASQPLKFSTGGYNKRKLMQLPWHLTDSDDLEALKEACLCNYRFLLAKLEATGFRSVLHDFTAACLKYPEDSELSLIKETLQLSQDGLCVSSNELAGQLAGRIHGTGSSTILAEAKAMLEEGTLPPEALNVLNMLEAFELQHQNKQKHLTRLMDQVRDSDESPSLLPHKGYLTPPGGQLIHKISGHTDALVDIALTSDGEVVVTGSYDKSVKMWHVRTGDMLQSMELLYPVHAVVLSHEDMWLVVSCWSKHVFVIDAVSTNILRQITAPEDDNDLSDLSMPITLCKHQGQEILVCMRNKVLDLWSLTSGELLITVDNQLDDWSIARCGLYIEDRHVCSHKNYFVYASYRGTDFFIGDAGDLSDPDNVVECIEVFDQYEYDADSPEPDFTPKTQSNIGALAINTNASQVVVSDGATNHIHFYSLPEGQQLKMIQFNANAKLRSMYFLPGVDRFLFCNAKSVGSMDLVNGSAHSLLEHECRVFRVKGVATSRYIITIAEDSILRIWDQKMPAYTADISEFTGKVKVSSKAAAARASQSFSQMFAQITGDTTSGLPDASSLLTTDDIENYWTKDACDDEFGKPVTSKVRMTFHTFRNPRYLGVAHDHKIKRYAFCFTIWEMPYMSCIRRMFFPDTVWTFCVVNDNTLVIGENSGLKLLSLSDFKEYGTLPDSSLPQHKPTVVFNVLRNELISESQTSSTLHVYDMNTKSRRGVLTVPNNLSAPKMSKKRPISPFATLEVSPNGRVAAVAYGKAPHCVLWSLEALTVLLVVDPTHKDWTLSPLKDARYSFRMAKDSKRLLLYRDLTKNNRDAKDTTRLTSCVLIDIETGKKIAHANPYDKANSLLVSVMEPLPIIRHFRRKTLQIVGIGSDNQAHFISSAPIGRYNTGVVMNSSSDRLVTWGAHPRDRTVRYWAYESNMLKLLGSFTPDREVTGVALVDDGRTLVIDGAGGLIKMQLHGKGIEAVDETRRKEADRLFSCVELNMVYPLA